MTKKRPPRSRKGKRAKRKGNTCAKDDDGIDELLKSNGRTDAPVNAWLVLFFSGAIIAIVEALLRFSDNAVVHDLGLETKRTSLSELFDIGCYQTKLIHCEKDVFEISDDSRTIRTRSTVDEQQPILKKGQLLFAVPRSVQTTTLDALRDERVRALLLKNPRHPISGKPLHPKTFLAVHMAFELSSIPTTIVNGELVSPEGLLQNAYLSYLPTHQEFLQFHPISKHIARYPFDEQDSKHSHQQFLVPSLTDHLIDQYFRYYLSEYQALCHASLEFQEHINLEDWITSRLIVQTRSFKVDPLTEVDISDTELDFYHPLFSDGDSESRLSFHEMSRQSSMRSSMVPLLDALDHHQTSNVGWRFMESASSFNSAKEFINFAKYDIPSSSHLSHSYFDSKPEPFVFAHYGFVNPYGSGDRAALLASYHRLLDDQFEINGHQDDNLRKYLAFRDGYEQCAISSTDVIGDNANRLLEFERVKFDVLKSISNNLKSWVAVLPPRNENANARLEPILSLCRLLAMTHRDYGGQATRHLQTVNASEYPDQYLFRVSSDAVTSEGLEYRAYHVLERLAGAMRSNLVPSMVGNLGYDTKGMEDIEVVHIFRRQLEARNMNPSSWEETSFLVRLEELETLNFLIEDAKAHKQQLLQNKRWRRAKGANVNEEDYIVRTAPCV